jgi:esterase/lipase superfamily enzyme
LLQVSGWRVVVGRRSILWGIVAVLAIGLTGCAGRPGPEVLTPVATTPGLKTVQLYVATTRERENPSGNVFTANRAPSLNFAKFVVSVPRDHKPGEVEMPGNPPDPQSSFAIVDQAVLSEADFRKVLASQGAARGKKPKAFVFVHGYNSNFPESLFRLAQLHADSGVDGVAILFAWPSQGQLTAYAADQVAAKQSRDQLMALLTMVTASPAFSDILVVAHSMGGMLTVEALRELRAQRKDRVIARLNRVVLAAPDIDAKEFRSHVEAIGPLKPPLLVLVSKDDAALQAASFLSGGIPRGGALDINDPIVRAVALSAKVQVVDISHLVSHDRGLNHNRFVSIAVIYMQLQQRSATYRNTPGAFIFNEDSPTMLDPVEVPAQAMAQ